MGKKRVPKAWKTLGVLLLALEGYEVVLELKTDVTVLGVVDEADAGMSCTLTSAQLTHPDGRVETMDQIYVSGRSVRYVHIPDSVNIVHVLARYVSAQLARDAWRRSTCTASFRAHTPSWHLATSLLGHCRNLTRRRTPNGTRVV